MPEKSLPISCCSDKTCYIYAGTDSARHQAWLEERCGNSGSSNFHASTGETSASDKLHFSSRSTSSAVNSTLSSTMQALDTHNAIVSEEARKRMKTIGRQDALTERFRNITNHEEFKEKFRITRQEIERPAKDDYGSIFKGDFEAIFGPGSYQTQPQKPDARILEPKTFPPELAADRDGEETKVLSSSLSITTFSDQVKRLKEVLRQYNPEALKAQAEAKGKDRVEDSTAEKYLKDDIMNKDVTDSSIFLEPDGFEQKTTEEYKEDDLLLPEDAALISDSDDDTVIGYSDPQEVKKEILLEGNEHKILFLTKMDDQIKLYVECMKQEGWSVDHEYLEHVTLTFYFLALPHDPVVIKEVNDFLDENITTKSMNIPLTLSDDAQSILGLISMQFDVEHSKWEYDILGQEQKRVNQEKEARRRLKGKDKVEEPIASASSKEKQRGGYKIRLEGLEERILMGHQTTGSQKTIAQHGLIGSQAREQRAKEISVAEKILDFFMPATYADEIPTEEPGSLIGEQSSSSRHYQVGLPGPKTFAEFYSTSKVAANPSSWLQQYGKTLQSIEQEELALSQATVKTLAGGFTGVVTGGVKAAKEIAATIYKLGRHATNLELLNNPEYEGLLSDEVKVKLQQEVAHTHEKIDVIVKNPGAFGKAVLTHYKMGFTEGVQKFGQGDFFGAGKQFGEMLVDVVPVVAGGYGAAKTGVTVASKLSVRALDLAGSSSKVIGKVVTAAGDIATEAVVSTAKVATPSESFLTFQYRLQQGAAALAVKEAKEAANLTNKATIRAAEQQLKKTLIADDLKLAKTNSPITNPSDLNVATLSKETQRLLGSTDTYKRELFERARKTKDQTTLAAAKIELEGGQIDLAIEKGTTFDHVTKVKKAQRGLLNHIENINAKLSHPGELPIIEREALTVELSKASKLLDYSEQYIPRTTNTLPPPKPRAS